MLGEHRTCRKTFRCPNLSDAFDDAGVHAHYETTAQCEAIELFPPAEPTFRGRSLLGQPYREVREWALRLDPLLQEDGASFHSEVLGFGVYAPAAKKNPDGPVESVIVFRRGYYDQGGHDRR